MIERLLRFAGGMLSDGGAPSSSRFMMMVQSFFACGWVTHYLIHTHNLPDTGAFAGLAAFIGAPYAINRFSQK